MSRTFLSSLVVAAAAVAGKGAGEFAHAEGGHRVAGADFAEVARADLQAVSQMVAVPGVMTMNPGVPASNLKELIALAKGGKLSYASPGSGSSRPGLQSA